MPNFDNIDRFDHPYEKVERNEDAPMEAIDPLREMYVGFNIIQETMDKSGEILSRDLESAKDYKEHLLKELDSTNLRVATLEGRLVSLTNAQSEVYKASQTFMKSVKESDATVKPKDPEEPVGAIKIRHRQFEAQPYAHAGSLDSDGGIHFGRNVPEPSERN